MVQHFVKGGWPTPRGEAMGMSRVQKDGGGGKRGGVMERMTRAARSLAMSGGPGLYAKLVGLTEAAHENPRFVCEREEVDREWARMRAAPVRLARPVVVLNGYHGPVMQAAGLAERLCGLTSGDARDFLAVSYFWATRMGPVVDRVVAAVEERWPTHDREKTIEVDVVGISMGGIVARAAAMGAEWSVGSSGAGGMGGRKRLHIRRLITLGTPHRGSNLARRIAPDAAARDLRAGSALLRRLDAGLAGAAYELVCYTRLRDGFVGARNTAPPGHEPIWVSGLRFASHATVSHDRRIQADVARRLRGEEGWGVGSRPPRD